MTTVSVIVPFYNAERHIAACAEALLAQTYPSAHSEILMIDNNSSDASAETVARHPRITLLSEKTQGAYAARNTGLRHAAGEILAFTDPDCVPAPDWLQEIAGAMANAPVGIVLGSYQPVRPSLALSLLTAYENEKNRYIFGTCNPDLYYGYTNNMAVRRTLFDTLGPFVERPRGSDAIFVRQVAERLGCDVVRYVPSVRVRHLEISSVWRCYQKLFVHGRSMRAYCQAARIRPLTNRERLAVFRRAIRSQAYPRGVSGLLFGLLALGLACWEIGRLCPLPAERPKGTIPP